MWVAVTLMLAVSAPAANEAEELFKKMEDKVHKAKTVEFESESVVDGPRKGTLTLKMTLAEGNKANVAITLDGGGQKQAMKAVSDGKDSRHTVADKEVKREATPKHLGVAMMTFSSRLAFSALGIRAEGDDNPVKADKFDKEKMVPLADFKLGKKEKVGETETQAVDYSATMEGGLGKFAVTVWIDTKTNLPVKRVATRTVGDEKVTITETIKTFKLDEKVDPKTFELPKE